MVVKIRYPHRKSGDAMVELEEQEAKNEIQIGIDNGYIPVYEGKVTKLEQIRDGQTITLVPPVQGG